VTARHAVIRSVKKLQRENVNRFLKGEGTPMTAEQMADFIEAELGFGAAFDALTLVDLVFERKNVSAAGCDFMGDDEHEAWTAVRATLAKARGQQQPAPQEVTNA
jgi:hypothetical protein